MDSRDLRRIREALRKGGVQLLAAYAARRFSDALLIRGAARIFRTSPRDVDEALDFAYNFRFADLTILPIQVRSEFRALLGMLEHTPPRTVLEIGTARGGTLFLFTRVSSPDALLISLDLPPEDLPVEQPARFGGANYGPRKPLYESFARDQQRVVFLPADSHSSLTFARVEQELAGRQLDLLFIDGDHSADGVRKDFEMYAPLVRDGGIIALHDVADGSDEVVGSVPEFWRSLQHLDTTELIEDREQGGYGLGIIRKISSGIDANATTRAEEEGRD
jgi:predicted O-methyltransferase YrrM